MDTKYLEEEKYAQFLQENAFIIKQAKAVLNDDELVDKLMKLAWQAGCLASLEMISAVV